MISEQEWNSIGWLEEARSLLRWLNSLNSGPALLMVRHSERPEDLDVPTTIMAELTEHGHDVAVEFGRRLPKNLSITIFHSPHVRATQTAERISEGLLEGGGNLNHIGRLNVLLGGKGSIEKIVSMAHDVGFDEFYHRWKQHQLPPDTLEPINDYLDRLTPQVIGRLTQADKNDLHLHVTHDIVIAASRGWFFNIVKEEGLYVPFLGGYGIARTKDIFFGFKGGQEVDVVGDLFV